MMEHECGLILQLLLLLQSRSRTWCQATILSFGAVCYIFWQGIRVNGKWLEILMLCHYETPDHIQDTYQYFLI